MKILKSTLLGGGALGGIGFVAGFIGPIIVMPEVSHGPLLGIFITGPLGFLIGGLAGLIVALAQAWKARVAGE
jgi:hypothetical protein